MDFFKFFPDSRPLAMEKARVLTCINYSKVTIFVAEIINDSPSLL